MKDVRVKFHSVSVIVSLLALVLVQTLLYLHRRGTIDLPEAITSAINSITLVIATVFISSLLLRLTIKWIVRIFDEAEERIFYSKIYTWAIYTIGIFVIMNHFGVSMGNITLFIGLITTGLAFAVRDVLLSFFGWMILLRKKPFRIGDYIRIGEDEGRVIHIGTFYVLLDKTMNLPEDFTRIPNRLFLEKSISILGKIHMNDQIRFQLAELPADKDMLVEALRTDLLGAIAMRDYISIQVDLKDDRLFLQVDYLVEFEQRQTHRAAIIDLAFKHFRHIIVFPK